MMLEFTEYEKGLIIGDSSVVAKDAYRCFMFTTTHKELSDKIANAFHRNNVKFARYRREHNTPEKENYEILEIIESYDSKIINYFKEIKKLWDNEDYLLNMPFITGILETKGTFFSYTEKRYNKEAIRWRISFSGSEQRLLYLQRFFDENNMFTSGKVIHRKDKVRESRGVISSSFRLYINQLEAINEFIKNIEHEEISVSLKEKIEIFKTYYKEYKTVKPRIYKHYKSASVSMLKVMNYTAKGEPASSKGYDKVIVLYGENGERLLKLGIGWEAAYKKVVEIYKEKTGFEPHLVKED